MRNESGSALAMVLGILAIVSLVGVGLLQQSRLDTRFTRAMAVSQHAFGLADGGAFIGIAKLKSWSDRLEEDGWTGNMILKKLSDGIITTPIGNYGASGLFKGYEKTTGGGWDAGSFYDEYWIVQGRGDSARDTTIIDAAIAKVSRSNYGNY